MFCSGSRTIGAVGDSSQLMVNFAVASRDFTESPLFSLWIKLSYELYRHWHRHWEPVARINAYEYYYRLEQGADVKEHLFEKTLTPSDVGKLNRLVIPKQHAEKYFPLDGEAGERDLLMSFEDEAGKPWRFRYSYWGSSQSYVITKGWSRFVKEKALDAGDVVLFHRLRGAAGDRLCISCRRRSRAGASCTAATSMSPPECLAHGDASGGAAAPAQLKRLRLFGVNLEYLVPQSELPRLVNVHETGQVHAHH